MDIWFWFEGCEDREDRPSALNATVRESRGGLGHESLTGNSLSCDKAVGKSEKGYELRLMQVIPIIPHTRIPS